MSDLNLLAIALDSISDPILIHDKDFRVLRANSAAADRLGLHDRGLLRQGCYADVVIFDPQTIGDRATFEQPHQLSVGVRDVWINGSRVLDNGVHTGARPGQIVEGPGRQ